MPPMAANSRQGGFFGILFVPYKKYVKARRACCRQGRDTAVRRKKDLIWFVRSRYLCALIRGLENLGSSRKGDGFILFALCKKKQKAHQRFANLWTPGTIQSSVGSEFAKFSGGFCRNRFCPQNVGEKALNRCERVTVVQTQDCEVSKKGCCTSSSQWVFVDEICGCTLVWV